MSKTFSYIISCVRIEIKITIYDLLLAKRTCVLLGYLLRISKTNKAVIETYCSRDTCSGNGCNGIIHSTPRAVDNQIYLHLIFSICIL